MNTTTTHQKPRGLLASASRLGVTVLALAENKCALFANEWEAERIWQWRIGIRVAISILALTLASLFAAAWLVLVLWDWSHSLAVLAPCAIFSAIAAGMWRSSAAMRAAKPSAFSVTREELSKDRAVLRAFTGAANY